MNAFVFLFPLFLPIFSITPVRRRSALPNDLASQAAFKASQIMDRVALAPTILVPCLHTSNPMTHPLLLLLNALFVSVWVILLGLDQSSELISRSC
jgi:hypothetical protein